jgi:hypothetical protein
MVQQRLPAVNGDDGAWGDILNLFLSKEHYNTGLDNVLNGGHKTITIQPGTSAALTAPLKFFTGPLMSTPEVGAVEFFDDGTNAKLYTTLTQATVATRLKVAAYNENAGATGDMYYRDSNGNFVRLQATTNTYVLTLAGGLPTWAAPSGGSGLSQQQVMAISSMHM